MSIYNVREHTAKTVNQELHSLVKSLEKIERRLLGKPGDKTLTELKAKQQAKLDAAIVAAQAGKTWRHRGEVAGVKLAPFSKAKAHAKALKIVARFPSKAEA